MAQLEKLYRIAIENEEKLAESEARCAALAAENAGLKAKGRELLGEACAVYEKLNKMIDPAIGDFIDGQTLHEFQFVLDCETPATDAFLAEVRAQGVDEVCMKIYNASSHYYQEGEIHGLEVATHICDEFAAQLRKGVQS
ncbi:hypothetical protein EKN87_01830 [Enterobacter hormaechei]|nr:hypothetical protein [Enterobacter hormaechei]EKY4104441.1 hypothetical protein [Enterobacter hormaechei subsp. steigerwaltii]NIH25578.1 hypothetical protein [Enterobacter cloacae complex sp. E.c70]RYA78771.1 hypothetical protein DD592_08900 [Enterobacter cloacae complex sp. 2DZ2F20B]HAS0795570.1 hypothetical protein [Enterobacter hormaechei subsp. xiangfangensis]